MDKMKMQVLQYEFEDTLIDFIDKVIRGNVNLDHFDIGMEGVMTGRVSDGEMCVSYLNISDNEMLYIYSDSEGMICLNTASLDKTFTRVDGHTYFGYDELEKKPFDFIQKVNRKLQGYFNKKGHSKRYHI